MLVSRRSRCKRLPTSRFRTCICRARTFLLAWCKPSPPSATSSNLFGHDRGAVCTGVAVLIVDATADVSHGLRSRIGHTAVRETRQCGACWLDNMEHVQQNNHHELDS